MVWKLKFSLFKQAYKISQLMEISKWTLKHLELLLKIFVTLLENLNFNENSRKNAGYWRYECSFRKNCNSLSLAHQFALARGTGDA